MLSVLFIPIIVENCRTIDVSNDVIGHSFENKRSIKIMNNEKLKKKKKKEEPHLFLKLFGRKSITLIFVALHTLNQPAPMIQWLSHRLLVW